MSYCRFAPDCDVYVYDDVDGGITIMTFKEGIFNEKTRSESIKRLKLLREKGLAVPVNAIEKIELDLFNLGETEGIEAHR